MGKSVSGGVDQSLTVGHALDEIRTHEVGPLVGTVLRRGLNLELKPSRYFRVTNFRYIVDEVSITRGPFELATTHSGTEEPLVLARNRAFDVSLKRLVEGSS
jgi:hypothetical protein